MGILFIIMVTVLLAGIFANYESSKSHLEANAHRLHVITESHLNNSFRMIDAGLTIYDNTFNEDMQDAFAIVMEAYNQSGGDPSRMDLESLKTRIGGMDIYIINNQSIIELTTKTSEQGLDFSIVSPEFHQWLQNTLNTSGFYPDRVCQNYVEGILTKYSYMPTPDHHYIIELGLVSDKFAGERMVVQYSDVVDDIKAFNPYLEDVLLFQSQKRLVYNTSYIPTSEESSMLDSLLRGNRTTQVVRDPKLQKTIIWIPVDLRNPEYPADMSIFAKLTYNDSILSGELTQLGFFHGFISILVLLMGGLIAFMVSRRISKPIEQFTADVDAIAAGDLNHTIQPVQGYELSNLAEKTGIMVERLKDQIRKREASEQRFMDLVQLLPVGVFESDLEGNITFANPAAFELFGSHRNESFQGLNIFSSISPQDLDRAKEMFNVILHGQKSTGSEFICLRKDGTTFPILAYVASRSENGVVIGARGSVVDVTRLKQIEAEVRLLNVDLEKRVAQRTFELEEATSELKAFSYSVSHDLKAPLRAIDGFSTILSMKAGSRLEPKERDYLEKIRQTVLHMNDLIESLLLLSHLNWQELKYEEISLNPLISDVVSSVLEQNPDHKVSVIIYDLPPCYGDKTMIQQVFMNLISNAVKFSRKRSDPQLEIGTVQDQTGTVYYVKDNGIGFDMALSNQIFKPFIRLVRTDQFEGSGVGLATVHRIIRRHGGKIWVTSTPGEGTTFSFTFPPRE
jgi:PAS domain S-box-containing protein